jgi:hypothetical protein
MNEINVIAPYKYLDMWVFDDPKVGLVQEPFVGGADTIIDHMVQGISNADEGFVLIFSANPFPGHQYQMEWRSPQGSGNIYHSPDLKLDGWLCPALMKYFETAPPKLFVQIKPR